MERVLQRRIDRLGELTAGMPLAVVPTTALQLSTARGK
jgi:hypothetical protein